MHTGILSQPSPLPAHLFAPRMLATNTLPCCQSFPPIHKSVHRTLLSNQTSHHSPHRDHTSCLSPPIMPGSGLSPCCQTRAWHHTTLLQCVVLTRTHGPEEDCRGLAVATWSLTSTTSLAALCPYRVPPSSQNWIWCAPTQNWYHNYIWFMWIHVDTFWPEECSTDILTNHTRDMP